MELSEWLLKKQATDLEIADWELAAERLALRAKVNERLKRDISRVIKQIEDCEVALGLLQDELAELGPMPAIDTKSLD